MFHIFLPRRIKTIQDGGGNVQSYLGIRFFGNRGIPNPYNPPSDKQLVTIPGVAPQHPPQGPHPGSFEARVPRFSPETTSFQIHPLGNLVFWAEFSFPFLHHPLLTAPIEQGWI